MRMGEREREGCERKKEKGEERVKEEREEKDIQSSTVEKKGMC